MKKILRVLLFVVIVLGVSFVLLPGYVQNALIHLTANVDDYEIFENRIIEASKPEAWKVSADYNQYALGSAYEESFEEYETTAFVIIKDSALYFEQYWDDYDEATISNSFSAAKSIVSLLVGMAIEEGRIESVFQPVSEFIPSFSEGNKANITVQDLLTMSSGIVWDEAYMSPFSLTTKAYYGDDLKAIVESLEADVSQGLAFHYKSINTQVLAEVLEVATGQSISDYATNRLWRKIGAEHNALWSLDKAGGMEKAYCCFNSTARDFARIGQLILQDGHWDDDEVVPYEYLEVATKPYDYAEDAVNYYGYQFWIAHYKGKEIPYARGILGQYIFVLKDKNAVVVRLGKNRSKNYKEGHPEDVFLYLDAAYELLK